MCLGKPKVKPATAPAPPPPPPAEQTVQTPEVGDNAGNDILKKRTGRAVLRIDPLATPFQ